MFSHFKNKNTKMFSDYQTFFWNTPQGGAARDSPCGLCALFEWGLGSQRVSPPALSATPCRYGGREDGDESGPVVGLDGGLSVCAQMYGIETRWNCDTAIILSISLPNPFLWFLVWVFAACQLRPKGRDKMWLDLTFHLHDNWYVIFCYDIWNLPFFFPRY